MFGKNLRHSHAVISERVSNFLFNQIFLWSTLGWGVVSERECKKMSNAPQQQNLVEWILTEGRKNFVWIKFYIKIYNQNVWMLIKSRFNGHNDHLFFHSSIHTTTTMVHSIIFRMATYFLTRKVSLNEWEKQFNKIYFIPHNDDCIAVENTCSHIMSHPLFMKKTFFVCLILCVCIRHYPACEISYRKTISNSSSFIWIHMSGLIKGISLFCITFSPIDNLTCMLKMMYRGSLIFHVRISSEKCQSRWETQTIVNDLFILPMIRKEYHIER